MPALNKPIYWFVIKTESTMNTAFENIKQGLQEAITHAHCDARGVHVHRPRKVEKMTAPELVTHHDSALEPSSRLTPKTR